ncbi:MAG: hypothetical protein ACM34J_10435 [Ignavibacteria bacterium]
MNTGQTILAVGAMILLSTIVLRVNSTFLSSDEVLDQSKYTFLATSIATSIIQEAKNLRYDDVTTDSTLGEITNPSVFTAKEFPLDPGEYKDSTHTFDDFDDYNGYAYTDSSMPSAVFRVSCRVEYVDEKNPTAAASYKTFHKRITVTVSSIFMNDVIQLSSIFSYWFFG